MVFDRLLQINVATLAALSALLLGLGERSALLPLGMLLAAVVSVGVTDVAGWFRLNRPVTSVAALVAVLLASWEVVELRSSVQVFAIANLLVYLQVILLFQEKELRTYWQLITLSLLQVVIAAAFNQGALFGVLLVFYLAVNLSAMVLLFLYRERSLYAQVGSPAPAVSLPVFPSRWPLAGQASTWSGSGAGSSGRAVLGRDLWGPVGQITVGTLLLSLVFFFTVPRLGSSAWKGPGGALLQTVGFSDNVTLGELGKIIENRQEVLRIHFLDDATRRPYRVHGEIFLRGSVFSRYGRGQWYAYDRPRNARYRTIDRGALLPGEQVVRQVITIEPMDRPELFCVWPFLGAAEKADRRIHFDAQQQQRLLRAQECMKTKFNFELSTTAFDQGVQTLLAPNDGRIRRRALLNLPPDETLPGLMALADEWTRQLPLDPDDRLNRARLLERMLCDSGRFEYSLEGQVRDGSLDPIEDFITKHPRGHCEYFATALVLMLRSQGIPARLVVGFKSDEWNELGQFFQVRQLHAHTWVEAYLEPRHLPRELIRGERHWEWADGAWLRLDPTPGGRGERSTAAETLAGKVDRYLNWIGYLWDTYVVEMDSPRQRQTIYRPTAKAVEAAVQRLSDPAWWRGLLVTSGEALRRGLTRLLGWWWLAAGGIVVVAMAMLLAYRVVGVAPRRLLGRLARPPGPDRRRPRVRVEFYHCLETLLARYGLSRPPHQTQREFARRAGAALAQTDGLERLAGLPLQAAEAFYRVRFGGEALDPAQIAALDAALAELDGHGSSPAQTA